MPEGRPAVRAAARVRRPQLDHLEHPGQPEEDGRDGRLRAEQAEAGPRRAGAQFNIHLRTVLTSTLTLVLTQNQKMRP